MSNDLSRPAINEPAAPGPGASSVPDEQPNIQILGRRVIALLIDSIVVFVLTTLIVRPLVPIHLRIQNPNKLHGTIAIGLAHPAATVAVVVLSLAVTIAYFSFFEILFGATPGKLLCSLRVIDLAGNRPGQGAIFLRNLVRPIDAVPTFIVPLYLVGGISVLLGRQRQRLGDRLGRTTVAAAWSLDWTDRQSPSPVQRAGIIAVALLLFLLIAGILGYITPPLVTPALKETFSPDDVGIVKLAAPGAQRLLSVSVGSAHRSGSALTYPLRFSLRTSGSSSARTCTGTLAFSWDGPLNGWTFGHATSTCTAL